MQKFENMKVLKFDNCEYLTEISNVSCLPNLEEFSFQNCENLITIDTSIGLLTTNVEKQHFLSGFVTTSHS
jgi:hypothetical protein